LDQLCNNVVLIDGSLSLISQSAAAQIDEFTAANPVYGYSSRYQNLTGLQTLTSSTGYGFIETQAAIILPQEAIDRGQLFQSELSSCSVT